MTCPLLSIVIPCYNSSRFISDTLSFLLTEGLDDMEVIVVDDGSSDRTGEIAKSFSKKDSQIRVFSHEKNSGVSVARNTGIKEAQGKFIYFLDSDDTLTKGSLAFFRRMIEEHLDCSLFLFGYETRRCGKLDKQYISSNISGCELSTELLTKSFLTKKLFVNICSSIYERELLVANALLFPEGQKIGEDVCFILHVLPLVKKAFYDSRITFVYQIRDDSTMQGYKTYSEERYLAFENVSSVCFEDFYQTEEMREYSMFFIQNNLLSNIRYYLLSSFHDLKITKRFCDDCAFFKSHSKNGKLFYTLAIRLARVLPLRTLLRVLKG